MCGIAGILNLDGGRSAPKTAELKKMIEVVHHRGPDGYGYYQGERVGLAHARLSIIDLKGGDQPIHNEDRTVQVVFNGEIFNYLELRQALKRQGHQFYTDSDTEVIVHLYEQYGLDFVQYLNGQFAIALWDEMRNRLILTRDRVGIRPLYYSIQNGKLFFSSEIKSLFTRPDIPRRIDLHALQQVFTFWTTLPPSTIFQGIESLAPGQMITIENGRVEPLTYWDWRFPQDEIDHDKPAGEWADELRALLTDAVRLQLRADVPVGAYLSGGLDSSVITSLIKHYTDTPLRTFSIGFDDKEFDETLFQQELVDFLGTNHSHLQCDHKEIGRVFPRVIWHTETPIVRTAPTPLMLLSGLVRSSGYKVVLTGEGADEIFGGYDIFKEAKVRRFWSHQPNSTWRPSILRRLYPYLKNSPTGTGVFSQSFFQQGMDDIDKAYFSHVPRWSTTQRVLKFLSQESVDRLQAPVSFDEIESILPKEISQWQALNRDQYIEAKTLLPGYLLSSQGDRMAMANSIEARFPFLDHRVLEFAATMPNRYKLMGLNEKYMLKRAMQGLIPENIRQRSKQPYRAPDSRSFFVDGRPLDYVEHLLSEDSIRTAGLFNPKAVSMLLSKCAKGRAMGFADNMAFVGILSSMLVHAMFIEDNTHDFMESA